MSEESIDEYGYEKEYKDWGEIDNDCFAVCPYCFYENKDPEEYSLWLLNNTIKVECDICKKTFVLKRIVDVTWRTERIGE